VRDIQAIVFHVKWLADWLTDE